MLDRAFPSAIVACGCIVLAITMCSAMPRARAQSAWSNDGTRAVEVDTKDADYYVNRANAFADNKDYDRAIADYNKALELDPQNAYAYNGRGDTLREAGKPAQGLPDAERALQLDSNNAEFWDTRAQIFAALGRRQEAIADYRRALALDPHMTGSLERLKRLGASP
jgi:tetratricopeptide (TPR) repeat protein